MRHAGGPEWGRGRARNGEGTVFPPLMWKAGPQINQTRKVLEMLKLITQAQARLNSVRDEETGATATEYALIIGVASIAIVAALALIAPAITNFVNTDIVSRL
jgi:Flp pilus assembly pilin Flp